MNPNAKPVRLIAALGALALVLLGALLAVRGTDTADTATAPVAVTSVAPASGRAAVVPVDDPVHAAGVPDRAYATLVEIDAGRWPDSANAPGTKGGEEWRNRGGDLPRADAQGKAVTYQEWDVNPKQRNRNRDAERIVTGSDGSAWYTGDHYTTFTRMR